MIETILQKQTFTREDLNELLNAEGEERQLLLRRAAEVKEAEVGNVVYLRGLIEFSNRCAKNCLYCGIRYDNKSVHRYSVSDEEILEAAKYAYEHDLIARKNRSTWEMDRIGREMLEVLFLLRSNRDREMTADEVSARLYTSPRSAATPGLRRCAASS